MTDVSAFYVISVFGAGLLSFFAPCILPLLPVYAATLSGSADGSVGNTEGTALKENQVRWRFIAQTVVFVSGLATTFVMLGFGAGALGSLLGSSLFLKICGGLVILLGLHQTGLLHLVFLDREKRFQAAPQGRNGILGAYLLGLTFSFGWTPCIGPVLASVLILSSSGNQALYGAGLMLIYTLGLAVPFLLISLFTEFLLKTFRRMSRYLPFIRIAGGILIIIMGLVLMTDNLNSISTLFTRFQTIGKS